MKPTISPPSFLPCDPAPNIEPSTYPDSIQPNTQPDFYPKSFTKAIKKPIGKKLRGSVDVNYKNKKAACWVSRCARNKPKPCADTKNTIEISEDSDSEIESSWPKRIQCHMDFSLTDHTIMLATYLHV